jgi:hypothetical protein
MKLFAYRLSTGASSVEVLGLAVFLALDVLSAYSTSPCCTELRVERRVASGVGGSGAGGPCHVPKHEACPRSGSLLVLNQACGGVLSHQWSALILGVTLVHVPRLSGWQSSGSLGQSPGGAGLEAPVVWVPRETPTA